MATGSATLFVTGKNDADNLIEQSWDFFRRKPYPDAEHWRDDYGWWGNAFISAYHYADNRGDDAGKKKYLDAAKYCWEHVLTKSAADSEAFSKDDVECIGAGYSAWNQGDVADYKSNPSGYFQTPNTVTNLGFWALTLNLFDLQRDERFWPLYIEPARKCFDRFYSYYLQDKEMKNSRCFNLNNLIVETPNPNAHKAWCKDPNRAWSADQGVFLYNLVEMHSLEFKRDRDRYDKVTELYEIWKEGFTSSDAQREFSKNTLIRLSDKMFREFFCDPKEGSNHSNFNDNYTTGPGVFMRFAGKASHRLASDDSLRQILVDVIGNSARAAWQNKGTDDQIFCWDAPKSKYPPQPYEKFYVYDTEKYVDPNNDQEKTRIVRQENQKLWNFAFQTGALDLFVALLRCYD